MLPRIRIAAIAAAAIAGLAVGGFFTDHGGALHPAALAATQVSTNGPTPSDPRSCKPAGLGIAFEALHVVAKDTGLKRDQILEQLRQGKSLNQIAGDKAGQVQQDLLVMLTKRLDKAVSSGRVTADQRAAMLDKAKTTLNSVLSQNLADKIPSAGTLAGCGKGVFADLIQVTAQQTGLTVDHVYAQLKAGKTIDQIAGQKAVAIKAQVLKDQESQLSQMLDRIMSNPFHGDHPPGT